MQRSSQTLFSHELFGLASVTLCELRSCIPRMSLPSSTKGIAWDWTGVGYVKASLETACSNRLSKPSFWKLLFGEVGVAVVVSGTGTSFSFNLRFMLDRCHRRGIHT